VEGREWYISQGIWEITEDQKMLRKPNELSTTTYEAKEIICPLRLQIEKIHVCPNDCILYRGEHDNLDECLVCNVSRYKILRDDPDDVEDEERPKKKIPTKVMWYAPIITFSYRCNVYG